MTAITGMPEQLRQRGAGSVPLEPDDPARPHDPRHTAPADSAVEATLNRLARLAADVLAVPIVRAELAVLLL